MIQRSVILERTIHHRDFEPTGAIELLGALDMLDMVTKVSPFVKTVVLEFYSNLTKGMVDPTSPDFRTVYVRGWVLEFLVVPIQPSIQEVVSVITDNTLSSWPAKGNVRSSILTTKYAILHKIDL